MLESNNQCCLGKILKLIEKLQKNSCCYEDIDNTCSRPFLGIPLNIECYNTRPVTLYTSNNILFEAPYTLDTTEGTSNVFRVEKVNNNSATLRVLAPNPDTTSTFPYVKTDSFITVNSSCICALRCLPDTFVD